MAIVTGDRYLEKLVKFVEQQAVPLIEGSIVLKLNPAGLHYVQSRLEALRELELLLASAPVDYLRAYVLDLGDHRALEQLRRILKLLTSLKVVSALPPPARDPTPLSLLPFGRLKVLELRGCDLSTSAAKGLLELRHTLEKIICHNSTDALRHVFASRIAEIKDSPQWNRLAFVSCSCNRLVLMDESLQLLPAIETLDLSRNRFAKIDNLRRCVKLKHLDLGFNHLRSVAAFSEVSCHIVKLVLRSNALTTLRGIENLKFLEALDISYNIISNFSELEFLDGCPTLLNLWLEGNPLCCSRWYRVQVFSYFEHADKLKLDDKEISTRELRKRQLIIARRHKRPANFGFYSPAKDDADGDSNANRKRKKVSRLAAIESEEESTYVGSDLESVSCDNEMQNKEENIVQGDGAEIVDLMNHVEHLKRVHSILWLRVFKEWMDNASETFVDGNINGGTTLHSGKDNYMKNKRSQPHLGESSRYVSDSVQASGDESSAIILESDNSFADLSTGMNALQCFDHIGSPGITAGVPLPGMGRVDLSQEHYKPYLHERASSVTLQAKNSPHDTFTTEGLRMVEDISKSPLTTIDDITDFYSSFAYPVSPPHYQEDILHRRHNLVEEILQLSAESYSVASSDSNTSCSDDDICNYGTSMPEIDQLLHDEYVCSTAEGHSLSNLFEDKYDNEIAHSVSQEADWLEKKNRRKHTRRVITLLKDQNTVGETEACQKLNSNLNIDRADNEKEQAKKTFGWNNVHKIYDKKQTRENAVMTTCTSNTGSMAKCSSPVRDDFVEDYFNKNVADSRSRETCVQYMFCCMLEQDSIYTEREVAVLRSSENKFFVFLFGVTFDRAETILSLLGCHKIEDVREVVVGLGLQAVRVSVKTGVTYLFMTRSTEKSRQLLCTLQVCDSFSINDKCSLRSLEQVQVEFFEKQICGGSKVSLFQYCMVLFWCSDSKEESWLSRSLFLIGGHVLVCIEDLMLFSSLSVDASSHPYYSVDSCCSVNNVSEMVIETRESWCITLAVKCATAEFSPSATVCKKATVTDKKKTSIGSLTWKFKWFSEESLLSFVALLKAMHQGVTTSPLLVRSV